MTEDNKTVVAAVVAPKTKRKYKPREAIYETKFSFTDENIVRVKWRKLAHDRRYDEKIPGLALEAYANGRITFFVFKNINMYNKKKNEWTPNVVYKKMNIFSIGFLGCSGGKAKKYCDLPIIVRSNTTAIIQETHIFIGHFILECVERKIL